MEAFNKLADQQLISDVQKEQLLLDLNFTGEDLWLKKYYLSKIKHLEDELIPESYEIKK